MNDSNIIPMVVTDKIGEIKCAGCGIALDTSELEPFSQIACPSCGTQLTVPAKLGQFTLTGLIASGGMGAIYRGTDDSLGREVAIKVMLESIGKDRELVETFKREARMAAALNHPNIVQIYSCGEEKGQPYIAMELVPGKSLEELMNEGALSEAFILKVGIDVTKGLSAAYEIGLMHGDVKPKNILFDAKGTAKVVDFGLATFVDKHVSSLGGIWGTPYYIAPEKILKQPLDARSDIYSLGATLYHALVAKPPFDGRTPVDVVKARLSKKPQTPSLLRKDISAKMNSILMRMLEEKPLRRYPTYASLLSDLENTLAESGATPSEVSLPTKITMTKKAKPVKPGESVQSAQAAAPAAQPEAPAAPKYKAMVKSPPKPAAPAPQAGPKPAVTAVRTSRPAVSVKVPAAAASPATEPVEADAQPAKPAVRIIPSAAKPAAAATKPAMTAARPAATAARPAAARAAARRADSAAQAQATQEKGKDAAPGQPPRKSNPAVLFGVIAGVVIVVVVILMAVSSVAKKRGGAARPAGGRPGAVASQLGVIIGEGTALYQNLASLAGTSVSESARIKQDASALNDKFVASQSMRGQMFASQAMSAANEASKLAQQVQEFVANATALRDALAASTVEANASQNLQALKTYLAQSDSIAIDLRIKMSDAKSKLAQAQKESSQ